MIRRNERVSQSHCLLVELDIAPGKSKNSMIANHCLVVSLSLFVLGKAACTWAKHPHTYIQTLLHPTTDIYMHTALTYFSLILMKADRFCIYQQTNVLENLISHIVSSHEEFNNCRNSLSASYSINVIV